MEEKEQGWLRRNIFVLFVFLAFAVTVIVNISINGTEGIKIGEFDTLDMILSIFSGVIFLCGVFIGWRIFRRADTKVKKDKLEDDIWQSIVFGILITGLISGGDVVLALPVFIICGFGVFAFKRVVL